MLPKVSHGFPQHQESDERIVPPNRTRPFPPTFLEMNRSLFYQLRYIIHSIHTAQEVRALGIWHIDWERLGALQRPRSNITEELYAFLMLEAFTALVGKSP
jgi:hypothetical protein